MPYKINFFAPPVDTDYRLNWESLLIELSLAIICTTMAFYGWHTGMLLMAYPAGFVAVMCYGSVIYTLISFVRAKINS
ncbi:hypothetical protein [Alteromonas lipolytica]|uniref:Uncharacterized protein n=1 Tax=Alteromonas lipolytica TaxID=1856405 RepID=A0A1E8FFK5_9ALTE|nr:hypothetical protein [Alteromonas lipolytica]OFI34715.1 hypothetical protein BFC17_14135 [Alteromonas lipolytica]GGF53433.1 hypothetical protein GCM10011338_01940 [Alteromonas lipolytica]